MALGQQQVLAALEQARQHVRELEFTQQQLAVEDGAIIPVPDDDEDDALPVVPFTGDSRGRQQRATEGSREFQLDSREPSPASRSRALETAHDLEGVFAQLGPPVPTGTQHGVVVPLQHDSSHSMDLLGLDRLVKAEARCSSRP